MTATHPRLLTVLFDANCSMCRHAKAWLGTQRAFVKLDFVAQISDEAGRRFPRLVTKISPAGDPEELVVVADDGRVWRGDGAWIMVLWALREHRALAVRLAKNPALRAMARRAFAFLSHNRQVVGSFLPQCKQDALLHDLKTPAGAAFEKRVMVCALPGTGGNGTLEALRTAQRRAG